MLNFKNEITQERAGEAIILSEALLWSLFPVVTVLSFQNIPSLLSLAWSTLFAAIFFGIIISAKKGWKELKSKNAIKDILLATFILGIFYYLLYFTGLRFTTAGNASLIAQSEIFFSFLFFNIWRKEYFSLPHVFGAILMLIGAVIVLSPNFQKLQAGDLFILLACLMAPFGNFFQKRARKKVKSESILFIRSLISAIFIFILAYFVNNDFAPVNTRKSFFILLINGFLILGLSKILWIEGIHRISVTKANALNSITPLLTLIFAWLLLGDLPTKFQLMSVIPICFGVVLLSINKKLNIFHEIFSRKQKSEF